MGEAHFSAANVFLRPGICLGAHRDALSKSANGILLIVSKTHCSGCRIYIVASQLIVYGMNHFYKKRVCVCMLAWAQMYLNDGMIKWSSLESGVIYELLFLCALFYFRVSCINVYYFVTGKK